MVSGDVIGSAKSTRRVAIGEHRTVYPGVFQVSLSERGKEIKRRRHRRKKLAQWAKRLEKATVSERAAIAEKIRNLTPGCEVIIDRWSLKQR